MEIEESGLRVQTKHPTVKFDDTKFYRRFFKALPGGKGVDTIINSGKTLLFLELKGCVGHEAENRWRTRVDTFKDGSGSFDIEVAQKVAMTLACLVGVHTKSGNTETAQELIPFCEELMAIHNHKQILVVFVLQGNFKTETRTKEMIMQRLQESLRKKLRWLNCTVKVVDSKTYRGDLFDLHAV